VIVDSRYGRNVLAISPARRSNSSSPVSWVNEPFQRARVVGGNQFVRLDVQQKLALVNDNDSIENRSTTSNNSLHGPVFGCVVNSIFLDFPIKRPV